MDLSWGLSKAQVKQIVKITSDKELAGRMSLQGLCYKAKYKVYFVTNGYMACIWDVSKLTDEALPKEDSMIHFTTLKEWLANAKAKDRMGWSYIGEKSQPNSNIVDIMRVMTTGEDRAEGKMNPRLLEKTLALFEDKLEYHVYDWQGVSGEIWLEDSQHLVKQQAIVLGLKK